MLTAKNKSLNKQTAIIFFSNIVVFFDFLIYFYLADILSTVFFPHTDDSLLQNIQVWGFLAVGYLARPFGGLILGRFGDRNGRKPTFLLTSLFIIVTSVITACLPTYEQVGLIAPILFMLVRLAQGMGFAAHSVLGWVYISEHTPKQDMGLYVSLVSVSFLAGVLVSKYVFAIVFAVLSTETLINYAWRLLFLCSAFFGALTLFLSRYLQETPFFLKVQAAKTKIADYKDVKLNHGRFHSVFLSILFSFQIASLVVVVALLLPHLIQLKFVVDSSLMMVANIIGIAFFMIGSVFYGILADKGHVGRALMIGSLFLIAQALVFYTVLEHNGTDYILFTYALLGFSTGVVALAPIIMLQLFATQGRLTSVAVIYNLTYGIVGGALPLTLTYATERIAFSPALYLIFVGFIGLTTGQYIYRAPKYKYLDNQQLDYL